MTPTDRRTRQYRVTHLPTGIVTVVQATQRHDYTPIAAQAGFRYPSDVAVSVVPKGQEIPLPWGEISLMLRPRVA